MEYVPPCSEASGKEANGVLVTGGRDGQMSFWQNVTERVRSEEKSATEERIRTDQKLSNYIQGGQVCRLNF